MKITFNDEAYELFARAVDALEGVMVTIDQTNGGPKVHGIIVGSNPDGTWGDEVIVNQTDEDGVNIFGGGTIPAVIRVRKIKVH